MRLAGLLRGWNLDNLTTLHAKFVEAEQLREQADAFFSWLEENPHEHFQEVAALWNSCTHPVEERKSRVVVTTFPAEDFIAGRLFDRLREVPAP